LSRKPARLAHQRIRVRGCQRADIDADLVAQALILTGHELQAAAEAGLLPEDGEAGSPSPATEAIDGHSHPDHPRKESST
jgi:hypothetical protein